MTNKHTIILPNIANNWNNFFPVIENYIPALFWFVTGIFSPFGFKGDVLVLPIVDDVA